MRKRFESAEVNSESAKKAAHRRWQKVREAEVRPVGWAWDWNGPEAPVWGTVYPDFEESVPAGDPLRRLARWLWRMQPAPLDILLYALLCAEAGEECLNAYLDGWEKAERESAEPEPEPEPGPSLFGIARLPVESDMAYWSRIELLREGEEQLA